RALRPPPQCRVATRSEHVLPHRDTPGARTRGVHRFVDTPLTDHYAATERDRFLAGLTAVDGRARSAHGNVFVQCAPEQRIALLTEMDAGAYASGSGEDGWFFRRMKELTLVGYYTSEIGASQELHVSPFGVDRGDIPDATVVRAWS